MANFIRTWNLKPEKIVFNNFYTDRKSSFDPFEVKPVLQELGFESEN